MHSFDNGVRASLLETWSAFGRAERLTLAVSLCWLVAYSARLALRPGLSAEHPFVDELLYLLPIVVTTGLAVWVLRAGRGDRLLWGLLTAGMVLWLAGDVAVAVGRLGHEGVVRFPSVADVFYTGAFLLYPVSGLAAFRRAPVLRHSQGLLDAVIVAVPVVQLTWTVLVAPQVGHEVTLGLVLAAAYPLLCVGGVVVLLSVGLSGYRAVPVSTWLIAVSLALGAVTNLVWAYGLALGWYGTGPDWLELGWHALAFVLAGAAVRVLSGHEPQPDVRTDGGDFTLVPAVVAVAATVVIALVHVQLGQVSWSALGSVVTVLVGLVMRLWLSLRDQRRVATQLRDALLAMRQLAVTDSLTELPNRRFLEERLADNGRSSPRALGLLVLDLDHFKRINDTHGHAAGDAVLVEVASRLARCVRDGDVLARYGGEEFAVLLPNTDPAAVVDVAERCRGSIADHAFDVPGGPSIAVTVSIGAASMPEHARTVPDLLKAADRALYAAKTAGRDRVSLA